MYHRISEEKIPPKRAKRERNFRYVTGNVTYRITDATRGSSALCLLISIIDIAYGTLLCNLAGKRYVCYSQSVNINMSRY